MYSVDLKQEILNRVKHVIGEWNISNIYAISFYVSDNRDNPCEPTLTIGYNTEEDYINACSRASNELEARWNYAFWRQNQELVFGNNETAQLVKAWIIQQDLPCFTHDEMFYSDICDKIPDKEFEKITQAFIKVLIDIIQELHQSNFIKKKFGKEIPVIIHELEYYDLIAEQNVVANGLSLVQGLVDFIQS